MLRASWLCFTRAVSNSGLRRFLSLALISAFSLAATGNLLMASSGAGAPAASQPAEDACKSCVKVTVSPLTPTIEEGEKVSERRKHHYRRCVHRAQKLYVEGDHHNGKKCGGGLG